MAGRDYSDAALVLVAHGSSVNADSATPAWRQAEELRRRGLFARVDAGFWKQPPSIRAVVEGRTEPRVFVVPMMISEGYFTEQVIPRELGFLAEGEATFARVQRRGQQVWYYCEPIGTHAALAELLLAQARAVVTRHPFPRAPEPAETALLVAGHGTERNPNSRRAVERQVERLRQIGGYGEVHAIYMEESPRIGDGYGLTARRHLVVVPCFVSDGLHGNEDIPVLLGEPEATVRERVRRGQPPWRNPTERQGKRVWYTGGIGSDPRIADIILERVHEAEGWVGGPASLAT